MISVLFIDNDPSTLNAIDRNFKSGSFNYNLITLDDPAYGFQKILENDVKVVISEISFEGFLCKTFYEELKAIYPQIIRISITTDQSLMESFNDDGQTHITFGKPINTSHFLNWLEKLLFYRESASEELIINFFTNVKLKSYPENIIKIVQMLNDKDFQMYELAKTITLDTNLKIKLLKFVNSASFGFTKPISDIKAAVEYLGVSNINSVVKYLNVFSIFEKNDVKNEELEIIDYLFENRFVDRSSLLDIKFAFNIKSFIYAKNIGFDETALDSTVAHIMHIMMVDDSICDAIYFSKHPKSCSGRNALLDITCLTNYINGDDSVEDFVFSRFGKEKVLSLKEGF